VKLGIAAVAICMAALLTPTAQAQSPPTNLTAADHPWDNGTRIDLSWSLARDDAALQGYLVRKRAAEEETFARVELVPPGTQTFTVSALDPKRSYYFEV